MKEKLHPIYKFMLVFPVSLVLVLLFLSSVSNVFTKSFVIAVIISILILKEK